MSRFERTIPAAYFDELYTSDPDPWTFATSPYEQAKYAATLDALPRASYARGLEVGCSIGVLTARLAPRCHGLLALDVADAALDAARARCADLPQVVFKRAAVPSEWPDGTFDLILLSEVVYYLDEGDIQRLADCVIRSIEPQGTILLVHWLGETNYPLSGDAAATRFIDAVHSRTKILRQTRDDQYRLDLLEA